MTRSSFRFPMGFPAWDDHDDEPYEDDDSLDDSWDDLDALYREPEIEGLDRFVHAQNRVWPSVIRELTAGYKRTHWMWFVFPQTAGLSTSMMGERYAIRSTAEAEAYWEHPVLGPRLRQCIDLVLTHVCRGVTLDHLFGELDALKFRSCLELFGPIEAKKGLR